MVALKNRESNIRRSNARLRLKMLDLQDELDRAEIRAHWLKKERDDALAHWNKTAVMCDKAEDELWELRHRDIWIEHD